MESQTEAKYRQIRAVVTVLIMPITIIAGYAMGYLGCLGVGYIFFDNYDKLLIWSNEGGLAGIIGKVLCFGGSLIGAVAPWVIFYFFNPDSRKHRRGHRDNTPTIIQV